MRRGDETRRRRALRIARMVVAGATVREAAAALGVSRMTAYHDLTWRLPQVRPQMAEAVRVVLDTHRREAPRRGGLALGGRRRKVSVSGPAEGGG